MNLFIFELENVLRFKRQLERLAEMKELKAGAAVVAARQRVESWQERLTQLARALPSVAPASWAARFEFSSRVSQALQDAERLLAQTLRDQQQARRERVALAGEVEALLTLRQQRWDEYQRDAQRAEQIRLDDVSMRGWTPPKHGQGTKGRES